MTAPTKNKHGVYQVRVPTELKPIIGKSVLKKSHETQDAMKQGLGFQLFYRRFSQ